MVSRGLPSRDGVSLLSVCRLRSDGKFWKTSRRQIRPLTGGCDPLRIRTAVLCSLAVGAPGSAPPPRRALEIGPVSVPVPVPPVAVTVPPTITVGPVAVPVTQIAPDLGASVTVSPQTGVGASVSLPTAIGPVPVLPGAPHDVQVGLGPGPDRHCPSGTPPAPGMTAGVAQGASPRGRPALRSVPVLRRGRRPARTCSLRRRPVHAKRMARGRRLPGRVRPSSPSSRSPAP